MGYDYPLAGDEVLQAYKRCQGTLEPIRLYDAAFEFKWSLQRLQFTLTPLLPEGLVPTVCTVALRKAGHEGHTVLGPVRSEKLDQAASFKSFSTTASRFPTAITSSLST